MSVRGEFGRAVGDAIVCLREAETDPARALAARLEQAQSLTVADLEGAARAVLDDWEASAPTVVGQEAPAESRLRDASERMIAIARIVLGEGG